MRLFLEAILYRIRTGCAWRDLPEEFGKPNSIFKKFNRWCKEDKLLKVFKLLSSHVKAHQHATGIKDQSISRSIGGNSSKIHLAVDANGNPIEFIIGDDTTHDVKIAPTLIDSLDLKETEILCADKGYDSELIREKIENTRTKANIPKKRNAKTSNEHMDWYLYRIRHLHW